MTFKWFSKKRRDIQDVNIDGGWINPEHGVVLSDEAALRVGTVLACVRTIKDRIASSPFTLYHRLDNDDRERATDDPLFAPLRTAPNPYMTAFTAMQQQVMSLLLYGNAYAQVLRDQYSGQVYGYMPLHPAKTRQDIVDNKVIYYYTPQAGGRIPIQPEDIIHVPLMSLDGLTGLDIVNLAREAVSLAYYEERNTKKFFARSSVAPFIVRAPMGSSENAKQNVAKSLKNWRESPDAIPILEDGFSVERIDVNPEKSQLIQNRTLSAQTICAIYGVPYSLLYGPRGSSEQEGLQLLQGLYPMMVQIEQEFNRKLLNNDPDKYIEFNHDGWLKVDTVTRLQYNAASIQWGWANRNTIARRENMPTTGKDGDRYLIPANMIPVDIVDDVLNPPKPEPPKEIPTAPQNATPPPSDVPEVTPTTQGTQSRQIAEVAMDFSPLLLDLARRITGREVVGVTKALNDIEKGADYGATMNNYYGILNAQIQRTAEPVLKVTGGDIATVMQHLNRHKDDMVKVGSLGTARAMVQQWKTTAATELVDRLRGNTDAE